MKPAFVMAGRGAPGSCSDSQVEDLQNSFREAIEATQQAIKALENLKKSPPLFSPDRRRAWKRQAQLLKALYNIDVDKSKGLGKQNAEANAVQSKPTKLYGQNQKGGIESDDTSKLPKPDRCDRLSEIECGKRILALV